MAGDRPGGVVLIAVLAWIGAVVQIVSGVLVITGVVDAPAVPQETGWIAIIAGAIAFVIAFFLFSGSNIARILVTISFSITILSSIFSIVAHPGNLATPLISALIAVIGLILLYTQKANAFFRR